MISVERITDLPQLPRPIGFVPTMGAFHEGHLQLMRRAKEQNASVVVSLFVNPTQFGKGEDYERYPRDLQRDSALAQSAGADLLFVPSVQEMYTNRGTVVHVPGLTERWEGAIRPGHFDGVATVVAKLFNIVDPDNAYFGLKDLQQCMVIKTMASDLNLRLSLHFEPTVRESDGLALSSRNAYLSQEHRALAPMIHRELEAAKLAILSGKPSPEVLKSSQESLVSSGFVVDYFCMVDLPSMQQIQVAQDSCAIIAAARLGSTRLIDNVIF